MAAQSAGVQILDLGIATSTEGNAIAQDCARQGYKPDWIIPGEAIGPLRRALAFGGGPAEVMPSLARAFLRRRKWVAAYACLRDALEAGVSERELADDLRQVEGALGVALTGWKATLVEKKSGA